MLSVSLGYTLSDVITSKGNLEKQEHQRGDGEIQEIMFTLEIAERCLRPLRCDRCQAVGHTENCLVTMTLRWDLRGGSILRD